MSRVASLLRWLIVAALAGVVFIAGLLVYDSAGSPVSTLMLGRWLTGQSVARQPVALAAISPRLTAAVVTSEDAQFCNHHGVDWDALHDVMNNPRGPSRGASTITMQTVKNLVLWPGRSYLRKALEIPLALVLDALWSKQTILAAYLNIAEWGDGLFGAEAAARRYFRKPASQLTAREAALLAAALPNPRLRDPSRPTRVQREHAARVLAQMPGSEAFLGCLR